MKKTIESRVLPHLNNIKTFDPAEPLEKMAERAGVPEDKVLRLNANENPYGPSPKVNEVLATIRTELYPDPLQRLLRQALGDFYGIDPKHIIAGAGSDELIDLLFRLFASPGDQILDCDPTFGMYTFCAAIAGAEVKSIPRDANFELNVSKIVDAIDSRTKMIFINSPNNPTGNPTPEKQLRALLETDLFVVVDEAYYEFSGETASELIPEFENLVVLRTFSKWAALAGLRVGYGFMSPEVVTRLISIKSPYNVNSGAEAAALASLEDATLLLDRVNLIVEERERVFSVLKKIPGIRPLPSAGNYILCEFAKGRAATTYEYLASQGIFLRRFGHPRLSNFIRTSIGTPEQNNRLLDALNKLALEQE